MKQGDKFKFEVKRSGPLDEKWKKFYFFLVLKFVSVSFSNVVGLFLHNLHLAERTRVLTAHALWNEGNNPVQSSPYQRHL
jgi:hypothetical protein